MVKKSTSFRLEPQVLRKLKYLGFDHAKPIGDVLEALVNFVELGNMVTDADFKSRFNSLFE